MRNYRFIIHPDCGHSYLLPVGVSSPCADRARTGTFCKLGGTNSLGFVCESQSRISEQKKYGWCMRVQGRGVVDSGKSSEHEKSKQVDSKAGILEEEDLYGVSDDEIRRRRERRRVARLRSGKGLDMAS